MYGGAKSLLFPKRGKRAVILCGGPQPPNFIIERWLSGADLFICADNAGHPYDQLPSVPDLVIGDFDSIAGHIINGKTGPTMLHVPDQDSTDGEKAILHAISEGCTEGIMLGATGGSLDHTLYNCALMEKYSDRFRICICNEHGLTIRCDNTEKYIWELQPGTVFSIIPFYHKSFGISIRGAAYNMKNNDIVFGEASTVSNHVIEPPLSISITKGTLLVHFRYEPLDPVRRSLL
jgi:thiamine pyrophosphokinase